MEKSAPKKQCPRCQRTFQYTLAMRKHLSKCWAECGKGTVEVTISSGHSTSYEPTADERAEYIDLDTALDLADAREDPYTGPTPLRYSEEERTKVNIYASEPLPNSRLPIVPASRTLRSMSYEDRVALGRKLERILEGSRRDDDQFDLQVLTVLQSCKERASYLKLSCLICQRKYKYKTKFKQHLVDGLLSGCTKWKNDGEQICSETDEEPEVPFILNSFLGDLDVCSLCDHRPLAGHPHKLAHMICDIMRSGIPQSVSIKWVACRLGPAASLKEIEKYLHNCSHTELDPLCLEEQLYPVIEYLRCEKLARSEKNRSLRRPSPYRATVSRSKSMQNLRSYERKSSSSKQTPSSASGTEEVAEPTSLNPILDKEFAAILLQQQYLTTPSLHQYHPDVYGGIFEQQPQEYTTNFSQQEHWWNTKEEMTDEFIISQLVPPAIDDLVGNCDVSADSGYGSRCHSSDQLHLQLLAVEHTPSWDWWAVPLDAFSDSRCDNTETGHTNANILPLVDPSETSCSEYGVTYGTTPPTSEIDIGSLLLLI